MKKLLFVSLALLLFVQSPSVADDKKDEKKAVSDLARDRKAVSDLIRDAMTKVMKIIDDKKIEPDAKTAEVHKAASALLDLPRMAMLTLGRRRWPNLDKEQRKEFTDLFVKQVKASYVDRLNQFGGAKIEFGEPVLKKNKFLHMLVTVINEEQRVILLYKLYRSKKSESYQSGGVWRIYDLEVEGVSIVKSYGAQYREFLQKATFAELLEKMKEKIQDVENGSKDKEKSADRRRSSGDKD